MLASKPFRKYVTALKPPSYAQAKVYRAPTGPPAKPGQFNANDTAAWQAIAAKMAPTVNAAAGAKAAPAAAPPEPFTGAEAQVSDLQRIRDRALAAIAAQRTATDAAYFDPNDPYSRQNALRRNFQEAKSGQLYSQASGGQLYSGSAETQRANLATDQGAAQRSLQDEYDAAISALGQREQDANDNYIIGADAAHAQADANFAADPNNTPDGTDPATGALGAPAADPGAQASNEKAHGGKPTGFIKGGYFYHRYPDGTVMKVRKATH